MWTVETLVSCCFGLNPRFPTLWYGISFCIMKDSYHGVFISYIKDYYTLQKKKIPFPSRLYSCLIQLCIVGLNYFQIDGIRLPFIPFFHIIHSTVVICAWSPLCYYSRTSVIHNSCWEKRYKKMIIISHILPR